MATRDTFRNHLRSLLWKVDVRREVDEEIGFHLEMRARELMEEGMDEGAAREAAQARMGDVRRVKQTCRAIARERDRRYSLLESAHGVVQDLSFAFRQLRKAPSWTVLVVLTLAAGIAANSVVFSVVHAVVLRPFPFPEPDRLLHVREVTPNGSGFSASEPNFLDFRERNHSLAALGAMAFPPPQLTLLGDGEPEALSATACTGSLFDALGVAPALGRTFAPDEDAPGAQARVIVVSHGLWARRFGGDPHVVGRQLNLDNESWTVVGVMPQSFRFPPDAEAWVPHAANPGGPRDDHRLELFGRLAPGVSLEQARQDLQTIAARLGEEHPNSNKGWGVQVTRLTDSIVTASVRRTTLVLQLAVGLMLLLACASVSNLLLTRAASRRQEIAVRSALGAGRQRILRQLLTETCALSLLGAALGLAFTWSSLPALVALNPQAFPRFDEVSVDKTVLLFTLLTSVGAGLLAGLAPALDTLRGDVMSVLREGRGSVRSGRRRIRDALVTGQVALAVALLVGAGLLVNSLSHLRGADPGFHSENVLLASISLPSSRYPESSPRVAAFYGQLLERVRAIPGVVAAGASMVSPYSGMSPSNEVGPAEAQDEGGFVRIQWRCVTAGTFRALGVPVLRGRVFDERDRPGAVPELPVVVSDLLARRLWPGEDAVGKPMKWGSPSGPAFRVIGAVPGIRDVNLSSEPPPMLFLPQAFVAWPSMTLFVKTAIDPGALAAPVRAAVAEIDPNLPTLELTSLSSRLDLATAGPRLNARLLGLFAAVALLVALMGIYGLVSHAVADRAREIGVRMALGARPASVVRVIVKHSLGLVGAGLLLGLLGALLLSSLLRNLLYEVSATDWTTYAVVAATTVCAGVLAAGLPALRVARVDPAAALYEE